MELVRIILQIEEFPFVNVIVEVNKFPAVRTYAVMALDTVFSRILVEVVVNTCLLYTSDAADE